LLARTASTSLFRYSDIDAGHDFQYIENQQEGNRTKSDAKDRTEAPGRPHRRAARAAKRIGSLDYRSHRKMDRWVEKFIPSREQH
jgi:hypothetical protein